MPRRRDQLAGALAAASLAVGVLAIGGAPRWAAIATSAVAVAAALCFVTSQRRVRSELVLFLGVATGLTALQFAPLPAQLVEWLSPERYALAVDNARALGSPAPGRMPLSYDAPATLLELIKLLGYTAFAIVCVRLAASRRDRNRIILVCMAAACALAALSVFHALAQLDAVYGFYEPGQAPQMYLGPLVNPNHLAAVLALAAPVAIGLAIEARGQRRALWIGATLLLIAGTLLTRSRGGVLGLALALVAGAIFWALNHRQTHARDTGRVPASTAVSAGIVALCALVLIGAATAGGLLEDLGKTTTDEIAGSQGRGSIWQSSARLVGEHKLTGVGRGASAFPFTRVQPDWNKTYSHVENEYLQAVVDWGLPAAALVAALFIIVVVRTLRKWRAGPVQAGIVAGLAGLGVHSLFDFGLQLPGVALPAIGLAAAVLPGRIERPAAPRTHLALRVSGCLFVFVLFLAAIGDRGRLASADADAVSALPETKAALEPALEAWERHPADYVIAGRIARRMLHAGDERAIPVLNRALYLSPRNPTLHLLAARALFVSGRPQQARIEMSLALRHAVQKRPLLADLIKMFPDPTEAARAVPTDDLGSALGIIELLRQRKSHETARLAAERVAEEYPLAPEVHLVIARLAIERQDPERAREAAERAYQLRPDAVSTILAARALAAAGEPALGIERIQAALDGRVIRHRLDEREAYDALAAIRLQAGDLDGAHASLLQLLASSSDPRQRARVHRRLATVEDRRGNTHQAEVERNNAKTLEAAAKRGQR